MIVISLTPTASPEQLEPFRKAHMAWAAKALEEGLLLAGGRLVPPTGGYMLARNDRTAVEAWIAEEPFAQQGLAELSLTEVMIMSVAPGLEALKA